MSRHEHQCPICEKFYECDGPGWSCDWYCEACEGQRVDAERPERDRDEDDGQTYADPATEMAERLERD